MTALGSRLEVAAKVDWEGGLVEAMEWGLRAEHMPEGDSELFAAWSVMEAAFRRLGPLMDRVMELLDCDCE